MLNPNLGVLLITHYQRLLNYITPDFVHVLAEGRIVKSGGKDLALRLEDEGYGPILREAGLETNLPDEALVVPLAPGEKGGVAPSVRRRSSARADSGDDVDVRTEGGRRSDQAERARPAHPRRQARP